jgi:hypothetical protein
MGQRGNQHEGCQQTKKAGQAPPVIASVTAQDAHIAGVKPAHPTRLKPGLSPAVPRSARGPTTGRASTGETRA